MVFLDMEGVWGPGIIRLEIPSVFPLIRHGGICVKGFFLDIFFPNNIGGLKLLGPFWGKGFQGGVFTLWGGALFPF